MDEILDLARPSLDAMSESEKLQAALKLHCNQHVLYPPFFQLSKKLPDLKWEKSYFNGELSDRKNIPKKSGVYAFSIEVKGDFLPATSYILYVGRAGDERSANTLFKRYYDYIQTFRRNDRPRVHEMLKFWCGNLAYYYAPIEDKTIIAETEKTLINILLPPVNRGDYSAELSKLLKGVHII